MFNKRHLQLSIDGRRSRARDLAWHRVLIAVPVRRIAPAHHCGAGRCAHTDPTTLSSNLVRSSTEEETFVRAAAEHGFDVALIAPAPSSVGLSRVGVLCLGSTGSVGFDGENYPKVRVLARALAMELHHWIAKSMREELLHGVRLTEADLKGRRTQ